MSDFNKYQEFTESKAVYNTNVFIRTDDGHLIQSEWLYPALGLAEEAGEVCGKLAKFVRKQSVDVGELRALVCKEIGDVMYMASELARQFNLTLQDVIDANEDKLNGRTERGTIVGEGDER